MKVRGYPAYTVARGEVIVRVIGVAVLVVVLLIGIAIGNAGYAAAVIVVAPLVAQPRRTRESAVAPLCRTSRTVFRSSPRPSIEMRTPSPGRAVNSAGGTMEVPVSSQQPAGRA